VGIFVAVLALHQDKKNERNLSGHEDEIINKHFTGYRYYTCHGKEFAKPI
jgi:hypothetical protein